MYKVFPRKPVFHGMSHYPPPLHKRVPKTIDISKEYPEYSNGDLHTQRLLDKMITTNRAPSPTQINPRNNYSNQIYYISKMQTYKITRKTCSPDYLTTVMDDHSNETVPQSVLTEHGLNEITCHMYTPAACGNQCLEGVDHVGIFIKRHRNMATIRCIVRRLCTPAIMNWTVSVWSDSLSAPPMPLHINLRGTGSYHEC